MPRSLPATAVANSQRNISAPRSSASSTSKRATGVPLASSGSIGPPATSGPPAARSGRRTGRRRTRPAARAARPRPGGSPCPPCRSTPRSAARATCRTGRTGAPTENVSLSRPSRASGADRRAERRARVLLRPAVRQRSAIACAPGAAARATSTPASAAGTIPNGRERRVPAADRRVAGEDPPDLDAARPLSPERRPGSVMTTKRSPALAPRSFSARRVEAVEEEVRLERRAGLRRHDEERPLGGSPPPRPRARSKARSSRGPRDADSPAGARRRTRRRAGRDDEPPIPSTRTRSVPARDLLGEARRAPAAPAPSARRSSASRARSRSSGGAPRSSFQNEASPDQIRATARSRSRRRSASR